MPRGSHLVCAGARATRNTIPKVLLPILQRIRSGSRGGKGFESYIAIFANSSLFFECICDFELESWYVDWIKISIIYS